MSTMHIRKKKGDCGEGRSQRDPTREPFGHEILSEFPAIGQEALRTLIAPRISKAKSKTRMKQVRLLREEFTLARSLLDSFQENSTKELRMKRIRICAMTGITHHFYNLVFLAFVMREPANPKDPYFKASFIVRHINTSAR